MEYTTLSHSQLKAMVELTTGFAEQNFEFWVSAQKLVYLTVFNIVYVIDVDGGWIARRKSDGELIDSSALDVYICA